MSTKAELSIDGKTFPILKCEYNFSQEVDSAGKPLPRIISDTIKLEVYGTDDETAITWATTYRKKLQGTISFFNKDQTVFKEVKFEDAYCIRYKEDIRPVKGANSAANYVHYLEISASRISIGNTKYDNHWPE